MNDFRKTTKQKPSEETCKICKSEKMKVSRRTDIIFAVGVSVGVTIMVLKNHLLDEEEMLLFQKYTFGEICAAFLGGMFFGSVSLLGLRRYVKVIRYWCRHD
eukprot:TRINITY_DN211_c0_g1_i1.p1 TRINITY_DN211_c0_g1~~TRINITY_DN211_c0_g1_i1.p1  ORF type:complete len:102 (-),score=16.28 TRINITY_DN211_c0_g1_i1:39-344(-)